MNEIKLYRAILHTGGKTRQDIRDRNQEWNFSEKDIDDAIAYYDAFDGMPIFCTKGFFESEYVFLGCADNAYADRLKEASYCMEQDSMFGKYINQREEFEKDWDNGDYEPEGNWTFDDDEIEILEALT